MASTTTSPNYGGDLWNLFVDSARAKYIGSKDYSIDVETSDSERNIPDMVDVRHGVSNAAMQDSTGGVFKTNKGMFIGLGIAGVLTVFLLTRKKGR